MSMIKTFLPLLISLFHFISTYRFYDVHFLISAKINGTSPSISFEDLEPNEVYLHFLFDFEYHNKHIKDSKNLAYFKISTNLNIPIRDEIAKNTISYRFSQKKWTQLKNNKIANNIMYKKAQILLKEKIDNIYYYYFKIENNSDKKITLVIRAPTQRKKKGFLSIENILEMPSKQKKEVEEEKE